MFPGNGGVVNDYLRPGRHVKMVWGRLSAAWLPLDAPAGPVLPPRAADRFVVPAPFPLSSLPPSLTSDP
jgi:hypothetical protein